MVEAPPPDDPLVAHLSGKREWHRVAYATSVRLRGVDGTYEARVLDVSRGGLLAAVEDPAFYADTTSDGLALVYARFPDGAEVHFASETVVRCAQIVRITPHGNGRVALGCSFESPLTNAEATLLGVAAAEAGHAEATAAALSREPRQGRPISIVLFAEREHVAGPYALGRILAMGDRAVDVALDGARDALLSDLAESPIHSALVLGTERLWEGELRIVACKDAGDSDASTRLRIRLMAPSAWGRRVAKHMRKSSKR